MLKSVSKTSTRQLIIAALAIVSGTTTHVFADSPAYRKVALGLSGDEYHTLLNPQQVSVAVASNAGGDVIGTSTHFSSTQAFGTDAFLYSHGSTTRIGLIGSGYEYVQKFPTGPSSAFRSSAPKALNDAGQVAGTSTRFSSSGQNLGQDAWLYSGGQTTLVNPVDGIYSWVGPNGTTRRGASMNIDAAGTVAGQSTRYGANGSDLGTDVWVRSGPGAITFLGLTGGSYERPTENGMYRYSSIIQQASNGLVVGGSELYASDGISLGMDYWIADSLHQTHLINLSGPDYDGGGATIGRGYLTQFNSAGTAVGYSPLDGVDGLIATGQQAWVYRNGSTKAIGLTGPGYEYVAGNHFYRISEAFAVNSSGDAAGITTRVNAAGASSYRDQDAWIYQNNTTRAIGLTGPDYEVTDTYGVHRYSTPKFIDAASHVTGFSDRKTTLGEQAWFYNGVTTVPIGLTGSLYDADVQGSTEKLRYSEPIALAGGRVLGISKRYVAGSESGQAGWLFDSVSGETTPLQFPAFGADNLAFTQPTVLTEQGVVLGMYEVFSGRADVAHRAFWWSTSEGFHDLGDLVEDGLPSVLSNYFLDRTFFASAVLDAYGSPATIVFHGLTPSSGTSNTDFVLALIVPGDTNDDDRVSFDDLVTVAQNYGNPSGQTRMTGDFNRDGATNFDDLVILAQNYGSGPVPTVGSAAFESDWALAQSLAPEPASLMGLTALAFTLRRRR